MPTTGLGLEFLTGFLPLDTATLTTFLMLSPAACLLACGAYYIVLAHALWSIGVYTTYQLLVALSITSNGFIYYCLYL